MISFSFELRAEEAGAGSGSGGTDEAGSMLGVGISFFTSFMSSAVPIDPMESKVPIGPKESKIPIAPKESKIPIDPKESRIPVKEFNVVGYLDVEVVGVVVAAQS